VSAGILSAPEGARALLTGGGIIAGSACRWHCWRWWSGRSGWRS